MTDRKKKCRKALRAPHSKPNRSSVTETPCYLTSDCYLLAVLPHVWRLCGQICLWEIIFEGAYYWGRHFVKGSNCLSRQVYWCLMVRWFVPNSVNLQIFGTNPKALKSNAVDKLKNKNLTFFFVLNYLW